MDELLTFQKKTSIDFPHVLEKALFIQEYENVLCIYTPGIKDKLSDVTQSLFQKTKQVAFLEIPDGEKAKSWETIHWIVNAFENFKGNKETVIVASGGGACLDAAGFAASILLRGVKLIFIPTTLLAMVDASIGGKTAINSHHIKNAIGTFYPADHIVIYPLFLKTLDNSLWNEGFAEIVKLSLVSDRDFYSYLEASQELWKQKEPHFIESIIRKAIEGKLSIVKREEVDQGIRHILNFGHTIGHALESYFNYTVAHGICVSLGMVAELFLSKKLTALNEKEHERVLHFFKRFEILPKLKSPIDKEKVIFLMKRDKKNQADEIKCVLLSSIGQAAKKNSSFLHAVNKEDIVNALDFLLRIWQT